MIAKLSDVGETRTPGAALISDPETTFDLSEADLPDDTIALLSEECGFRLNQDYVKRTISDTTARLEFLLSNHLWAVNEIDSEAYVRMDAILHVLWRILSDSGKHGPMPSYLLLAWVFIYDTVGIFMPWISMTPHLLLSYVERISQHDNSNALHRDKLKGVPLLARPQQKSMFAGIQLLKDGIVTHVKSHIGHISTLHGTLPTHSIACQSQTANSLALPKLIEDGTITPTICIV